MPKVPLMTARASTLPVAILLAVLGLLSEASSADTPCLIGFDATGLELGNRQLSVALKNANAEIDSAGVQCEPASGFLDPGISDASTGQAAYAAGSEGFSARSSALAAGESSGTVRVAVQGSVSILVRVESDYSGAGFFARIRPGS